MGLKIDAQNSPQSHQYANCQWTKVIGPGQFQICLFCCQMVFE